jgi:hypothetical protein
MLFIAVRAVLLLFGNPPPWTSVSAIDVHVVHRDLDEAADLLRRFTRERGGVVVNSFRKTLRIVDVPWEVDRLTRLLREVDEPEARGQKIWLLPMYCMVASDFAAVLSAIDDPPSPGGVLISKIVPEDRANQLILVANRAGYRRVRRMRSEGCPDPLVDETGPIDLPIVRSERSSPRPSE